MWAKGAKVKKSSELGGIQVSQTSLFQDDVISK